MRILICAKDVPDPDALNAYVVAGRLTLSADNKAIAEAAIPLLINAYDEQAIEAALRLRDEGHPVTITVVSVEPRTREHLKRAAALGVDETVCIHVGTTLDTITVGKVLARYVAAFGPFDLILCGRQASDDDQGVVPAALAEFLHLPLVTMARALKVDGQEMCVVRVSGEGDEVVSCCLPAVATITSELGTPRFPNAAGMLRARRTNPTDVTVRQLGLEERDLVPHIHLQALALPHVDSACEFLPAEDPDATARDLLSRLRTAGILS